MQDSSISSATAKLLTRIANRDYVVGVMGLGYVGLPLAISIASAGFRVVGFDTNKARVEQLNAGRSGIKYIADNVVRDMVSRDVFRATADMTELGVPDALLIAVPTPLTRNREPDLSFIESSTRAIATRLREGQLIVLESTTWPGTTREIMQPILEQGGAKCGVDFHLAYSPEREDPGNKSFSNSAIPKVVGADHADTLQLVEALYACFVPRVVPVSSMATAEAVKITENIFRSVNIALVNELKLIYEKMGIDVWEVIEAAKSKPFGYMAFYPGPGLGGHCIPIDPFYLTWKAREFDVPTRFVELAGEINVAMPRHVVERVADALDRTAGKALSRSRILVVGLAYKKNVDDTRESPALKLIELLEERGAEVAYHDPLVPQIPPTREHAALAGRRSIDFTPETLASFDAALIATDHDDIDWPELVRNSQIVVDTRNVCARNGLSSSHIVKA